MKRPVRNAYQTSMIKIWELHPLPFKTINLNWMKNRNLFLTVLFSTIIFVWMHPHSLCAQDSSVQIIDLGNYYQVTIDYTSGISHFDMGVELGQKMLQTKPDYEQLMDSYIAEYGQSNYNTYISRVHDIKPQMHQAYQDEIDGMASQLSGGNVNSMGDNKLSKDELYLLQLITDVPYSTQCSGISVYGARSETSHPMTARLMDWDDGSKHQLAQVQAVTTIKYNDNKTNCLIGYGCKSICLIGYLGHLTMITGFNSDGVFAGIVGSGTGAAYSSTNKYSYATDLRYALENSATLSEVASYVTNPSRNYTNNHNVILSDIQTSKILENNFSGTGTKMQRELRSDTSALNPGITWGFTDAVAVVNSFLLQGNHDNHTRESSNINRWQSFKTQLQKYGDTITLDELKLIASFDNNDGPGSQSSGDIYNRGMQHIVLFQPDNFHLEVAFRPKSGILPADPVFEYIPLLWKNNLAYGHTLKMDKKSHTAVNDTITISAIVENPNSHQLSANLIFESLDGLVVDSIEMTQSNLQNGNNWQGILVSKSLPENNYWVSLKVTDHTTETSFNNKHMTRITNKPLEIGTLSHTEISENKYSIKTEIKNSGKSTNIISPIIKITSDNSWIKSIAPEQVTISGLNPGDMKRIPSFTVTVDEATFPGYVDLSYTISEDGWPLWVIDTTIYFIPTGLEQIESSLSFNLEQNYPNPFNSSTTIPWQLAENSKVTLKVLDIIGRTIEILVDEQRPPGNYETQFSAATLPKGIYFYQLKAGENEQTRKMILLE